MIGYLNYLVFLFIVTGLLILRIDMNMYLMARMKKEQKVAKWLGWINVLLGTLTLITSWVYYKWLW